MARLPGVSSAPPTPCNPRAAMSRPMFGAVAQMSDATANHATPMTKIWRRPKRSQRAPERRMTPATVSRYPAETHCRPEICAWNSLPMAGCAMPTTVASSCATALPSTVAVSTQRPRAVLRWRAADSSVERAPGEDPDSVTPLDVAVEAGRLRVSLVRCDAAATGGDRRGCAGAGEHEGFPRQWKEARGDARHDRLEVAARGRLAGTAVEEGVARDQSTPDAQGDTARRVARRVDHADPCVADPHFGAVLESAVDPLFGNPDLTAPHQHRRTGGGTHRVVRHPVVGMPVGRDDRLHDSLCRDCLQQRLLVGRHVHEHGSTCSDIAHDVGVVAVRPHRSNLADTHTAA